jgi:hypothetical protein
MQYGRVLALAAAVTALAAATAGCSAVVDPDVGRLGSPPPPTCMPGRVVNCACNGGLTGKQVCNDGGTYNPCNCGAAGVAGAAANR